MSVVGYLVWWPHLSSEWGSDGGTIYLSLHPKTFQLLLSPDRHTGRSPLMQVCEDCCCLNSKNAGWTQQMTLDRVSLESSWEPLLLKRNLIQCYQRTSHVSTFHWPRYHRCRCFSRVAFRMNGEQVTPNRIALNLQMISSLSGSFGSLSHRNLVTSRSFSSSWSRHQNVVDS